MTLHTKWPLFSDTVIKPLIRTKKIKENISTEYALILRIVYI